MKKIILFTLITLLTTNIYSQPINKEIISENDSSYLLGKIDMSGLQGKNYNSWFTKNYEDYQPNSTIINQIKDNLKAYQLKLFLGTWCGDSKTEVPRLLNILEACDYPMEQLEMVALSSKKGMYKQSPEREEAGLNIHRVPTLIVYKNGKEVNRIVEHPIETFEKDLANIIGKNDYKSNYQIVTEINTILNKKGIKGFKKKADKLLKFYKGKTKSMYALNTYSYILMGQNKIDEAIEVLKFNTQLFKNEPRTFRALANAYKYRGELDAKVTIKEALKMYPNNDELKTYLEALK